MNNIEKQVVKKSLPFSFLQKYLVTLEMCIFSFSKIQLVVYYDWLSYYQAVCYSPLVAKSDGFLAAKEDESLALTS